MATRKTQDDPMARTEAERGLAAELLNCGVVDGADLPVSAASAVLGQIGKTVEFERGASTDPDRQKVRMRRLVITGPWFVDPDQSGQLGE